MLFFRKKRKNFLDCWADWRSGVFEHHLIIFSDFDGTLAPIVERPELARLPMETKALLQLLANGTAVSLVIVTGRTLEDIRRRVGIDDVAYIANHGFEIEAPNVQFRNPLFPKTVAIYDAIERELRPSLRNIPGVIFEDKGIVRAIHYRQVKASKKDYVRKMVKKHAAPYIHLKEVAVRHGKEVVELRPAIPWDKGKAVLWLLSSCKKTVPVKSLVFYLGDDESDEDAFRSLRGKAVTIRVGKSARSAAEYYVKNTDEVSELLSRIQELKRK